MSPDSPQQPRPQTKIQLLARILVVVIIALILAGALITGLMRAMTPDGPDVARPTLVTHPYGNRTCTIELEATDPDQPPNRAVVTCGDETQTLAGDFRDQSTNHYDPETTDGITSIVAIGNERRMWIDQDDVTCTIIWTEGDEPAPCDLITSG